MSGAHEPREEFVNQLELQLRADLRRRNLATGPRLWTLQSTRAAALTIAAIALGSMALGGGVVATAYEVRLSEQRNVLLETMEQQAVIARQRLALAIQQLQEAERRVSVGIAPGDSVSDAQFRVRETDAEVKLIDLGVEEIRASSREPMQALSAPLVSGRDFVTERLRVQMSVPVAAIDLGRSRIQAARTRINLGVADPNDLDRSGTSLVDLEARVAEAESAVGTFQRKLEIRQTFLKNGVTAVVADLRGLQAEAEGRRLALGRQIDAARGHVQALKAKVNVGTVDPLKLAESELRLQQLQLDLTKADYDVALVLRQLAK